jgi:hypothetical protein
MGGKNMKVRVALRTLLLAVLAANAFGEPSNKPVPIPEIPQGPSRSNDTKRVGPTPGAKQRGYDKTIIWRDESKDPVIDEGARPVFAEFIPEDLLNSIPVDELPLLPDQKRELGVSIERGRGPVFDGRGRLSSPCRAPQGGSFGPRIIGTTAQPLVERLRESPFVLAARVVDQVAGWSNGRAKTAFFLKPETILRDWDSCIDFDKTYVTLVEGAQLQIDGSLVCSDIHPGYYWPKVGDKMFISGACGQGYSENYIHFGLKAEVEGTQIIPEDWHFLSPERIDIEELQHLLEGDEMGHKTTDEPSP